MKKDHYFDRKWGRDVTPQAILDALKNPNVIREKLDHLGRTSYQYIADKATVVVNDTGLIITMWKNGK